MKQKTIYLTAIIFAAILLFSVIRVIAADQIRPAPQTESRGVGEQIRPANQQNLPTEGNGDYHPSEGSSYSSSVSHAPPVVNTVELNATLNNTDLNTTSNATGTGDFVLNTDSNELSYNIDYSNLSSNETGAELDFPGLNSEDNQTVSYILPLGELKQGILNLAEDAKNLLLNNGAIVKIRSMLFPDGEVSGYIRII